MGLDAVLMRGEQRGTSGNLILTPVDVEQIVTETEALIAEADEISKAHPGRLAAAGRTVSEDGEVLRRPVRAEIRRSARRA